MAGMDTLCRALQLGDSANIGFFLEMITGWRGGLWSLHLLVDKWTFAIPPFSHRQPFLVTDSEGILISGCVET